MAKERPKSPRARLFCALDLPDDVREGLAGWQGKAMGDEALRPVRSEALHITLCFLSYRPERDIDRIGAIVGALEPRVVPLRFEGGPTPVPPSRPRLYALDTPSEAALALQAELSAELEAKRLYKPEKRPFWPHVTVARVRPEKGRRNAPRRVTGPPGPLPEQLRRPFGAVRVALYRSNLKPSGAEYVRLASLALPQPASE